jgi:Uma2 family endonuclease
MRDMAVRLAVPPGEHVPTADQRVVMYGVPWSHYEAQLALRGDVAGPRLAYLEGALEFMSPSKDHERIKSYIGRLIEAYALELGLDLSPYGSWTLKKALKKAGVEPDECYIVGADQSKETPDLAIEVAWTSGGIDKLEIYRRLHISEVWFWEDQKITLFAWAEAGYERIDQSRVLPGIDVELVTRLLDRPTALQAIRALREALHR